ncbi:MAG: AMP-binding protein [Acidobacteria bacterium]|nr:AMP-binding protein [Acidobacteriota bacterium]
MMQEQTLAKIVENFHRRNSETAYVCRRGYRVQRWSYRQVADAALRLAGGLQDRGIAPGDRIILWGEDCAEWVLSFFACVLCGAVTVPMDRKASIEFVRRVCQRVEPKLCIASRLQPLIEPSLNLILFESLSDLLRDRGRNRRALPGLNGDDAVEIVFTSGTTDDPKGVVLSHKNILANLDPLEREIARYLKYERIVHPLRFLNLLPLSHVFGQFLGLFIPQILGGTVIFHDTLNPSEIIQTIKKERISVLVTVPRVMETLQTKIERDLEIAGTLEHFCREFEKAEAMRFLKRWWRFRRIHSRFGWKFWAFICGGATLPARTEQFWGRLGFAVIQGYGLTETTSMISINHPFKLGKGSIGKVLPGREVRLSPEGEILVRGDSIAKSYLKGQDAKPVSGEEDWFHTGDIGVVDKEGNLYFKGRLKNVIVSPEGMNIYPEDLEIALRRQPEVRDCVVLELDREGNPEACAVLILRSTDKNAESAVERANESLAEYQRIRHWFVWPDEDFPRTSTQKPQTKIIQEYIQEHSAGVPVEKAGSDTLADLITRVTGRKIKQITPESSLTKDLNLSSIERVELLSALEDRYQLDLNESRFTSASTVEDLERMLQQPSDQRTSFHYPRWAQNLFFSALRILVYYLLSYPATLLMAFPRIHGRDNLRNLRGPVLFVANHITQVDIGFILAALPLRYRHRLAVAMLGELLQAMRYPPAEMTFIKRWMEKISYGMVVALFNVFPLPQKTGFRGSFAFAGESADRGYSILVFPEGKRTQDGNLSPFQAGVGLMATNLGIPVVPVKIDGLFNLKRAGKKFSRPGTVKVTIGSAVQYASGEDPLKIAQDLEKRMRSL